jgi:hypothetical protein
MQLLGHPKKISSQTQQSKTQGHHLHDTPPLERNNGIPQNQKPHARQGVSRPQNIQNAIIYVHLESLLFDEGNDEFHVTIAKNVKEASNLVKVGFQYVTGEYDDGGKIFRKRK